MNLANKISTTRILVIPVFIAAVLYSKFVWAAAIFIIAVISDGLDGYIARVRNERTQLGALLDPIADKLLLISAFVCFSLVSDIPEQLRLPPYVPIIIISRDMFMGLGCLIIYVIKGKIEIIPTRLGKVTTFLQMLTIIALLFRLRFTPGLWNTTIVFTVASGLDYIIKGSRLLNDK